MSGRNRVFAFFGLAAVVVVAIVGVIALSGDSSTAGTGAAAKSTDQTLTVAIDSLQAENWLPHTTGSDNEGKPFRDAVYDYLIYLKADSWEPIPGIATEWGTTNGGLTWFFDLRKGVEFHEGYGELTAEDVKFSIDALAAKDSQAVLAGQMQQRLKEVRVVDPYRVEVDLKSPWPGLDVALSSGYGFPIVSKSYVEKVGVEAANKKPVGSGPYVLESQVAGNRMEFRAVDKHWRVTPQFGKLVVRAVADPTTRLALLQRGDVDIAPVPLTATEELKTTDGRDVLELENASMYGVTLAVAPGGPHYDKSVPWMNVKVREALNLAIDRETLVEKLFGEFGRPTAAPYLLLPGTEDREPYPYDPDRAKQLLAEAGYPNGFTVPIWNIAWPASVGQVQEVTEAVAQYWQEIGVKPKIVQRDLTALVPHLRSQTVGDFVWAAQLGLYVDHELIGNLIFRTDGGHPIYWDKRIDALWDEVSASTTDEERDAAETEIGQILYDSYAMVPIAQVSSAIGINTATVGHWEPIRGLFLTYWEYATTNPDAGSKPTVAVY